MADTSMDISRLQIWVSVTFAGVGLEESVFFALPSHSFFSEFRFLGLVAALIKIALLLYLVRFLPRRKMFSLSAPFSSGVPSGWSWSQRLYTICLAKCNQCIFNCLKSLDQLVVDLAPFTIPELVSSSEPVAVKPFLSAVCSFKASGDPQLCCTSLPKEQNRPELNDWHKCLSKWYKRDIKKNCQLAFIVITGMLTLLLAK